MKTTWLAMSVTCVALVALAAPPMPATPVPVDDVVYARPFRLDQSFRFDWRKEEMFVSEGTILVLRAKPELLVPHETPDPVLYVGNQTAKRLNRGDQSGYLVVLVPGAVDLANDPAWFGAPTFPSQVDAARIAAERDSAVQAGVRPISARRAETAVQRGGTTATAPDLATLLRGPLGDLVLEYSPQEKPLVEAWRLSSATPMP